MNIQVLKQSIINLLGNAIKFTQRGYIQILFDFVKTDKHRANIVISIEDRGIGLGLSISKRLLDLMNGTISLYSKKGGR